MDNKIQSLEKALEQFPQIVKVIGKSRVLTIAKENPKNTLIYYLERTYLDEKGKKAVEGLLAAFKKNPKDAAVLLFLDAYFKPNSILKHLDRCLGSVAGEPHLDVAISHLLDSKAFWQGYAEIEMAAYIKKKFGKVTLEPILKNGKSVDMKYNYNKNDYYVEVTTPKIHHKFQAKMEESAQTGKVVNVDDSTPRATEKILTELEHFKGILDETKSIIIINVNGSEFDELEVDEALLGVSSLAILKDSQTGNFVGTEVVRGSWNAFEADEDLKKIGIVMTYKREFAIPTGEVAFTKKIFVIALDKEEANPLEDVLS